MCVCVVGGLSLCVYYYMYVRAGIHNLRTGSIFRVDLKWNDPCMSVFDKDVVAYTHLYNSLQTYTHSTASTEH